MKKSEKVELSLELTPAFVNSTIVKKKGGDIRDQKKFLWLGWIFLIVQIVWAIVIPIKNVYFIPWPILKADQTITKSETYESYHSIFPNTTDLDFILSTRILTGEEVLKILKNVVHLVFTNQGINKKFLLDRKLKLTDIGEFLTPKEHHLMSQYFSLVYQCNNFQSFRHQLTDFELWIQNTTHPQHPTPVHVSCPASQQFQHFQRCTKNPSNTPCEKILDESNVTNVENIDYNSGGFQNAIFITALIDRFQQSLNKLFETNEWNGPNLQSYRAINFTTSNNNILSNVTIAKTVIEEAQLYILDETAKQLQINTSDSDFRSNISACFISEIILAFTYAENYTSSIIEEELINQNLYPSQRYMEFSSKSLEKIQDTVETIMKNEKFFITHQYWTDYQDIEKFLFGWKLTSKHSSKSQYFRGYTGLNSLTSGTSSALFSMIYPLERTIINRTILNNDSMSLVLLPVGTTLGGRCIRKSQRQIFKNRVLLDDMKIKEEKVGIELLTNVSPKKRTKAFYKPHGWWDHAEAFEKWYLKHMLNYTRSDNETDEEVDKKIIKGEINYPVNSTYEIIKRQFPFNNPFCIHDLSHSFVATAILVQVKLSPWSISLLTRIRPNKLNPETLIRNEVMKDQLFFDSTHDNREIQIIKSSLKTFWRGSEWIFIQIMHLLQLKYSNEKISEEFFLSLEEHRKWANNINRLFEQKGIYSLCSSNKTKSTLQDKYEYQTKILVPLLKPVIKDLLEQIPSYYKSMIENVDEIDLQTDYFLKEIPQSYGYQYPYLGYETNAYNIGFLKASSLVIPKSSAVSKLRSQEVCYESFDRHSYKAMLDCYIENSNTQEERVSFYSFGLRLLLYSNWSLGVTLNLIVACISILYARKVYRVYKITRFVDLTPSVALQMDIQGPEILTFNQILLFSFSSIPLIIGHHIIEDHDFVVFENENITSNNLSRIYREFLISISLTWFIRLGESLGASLLNIHTHNWWLLLWVTRVRHILAVIIFSVRLSVSDPMTKTSYDYSILIAIMTCLLATGLGASVILMSIFIGNGEQHRVEGLSKALNSIRHSRSHWGVCGYTIDGWAVSGLCMEGWEIVFVHQKRVLARENLAIPIIDNNVQGEAIYLTEECDADDFQEILSKKLY